MPGTSRRTFIKNSAMATAAFALGDGWKFILPRNDGPLIDAVEAACRRLAPLGWRQMMLDVTDGGLDIGAADLRAQLTRPLARIDRGYPGFGDFDEAGARGIEAGEPDRSLLYHAFASPTVVAGRTGAALGGFPTLAEIDAVENFVYGVQPPTLEDLRQRAGGAPLGIVVYALQYRNTPDSVHGKHAELCFARTGIARLGTIEPLYDGRARRFAMLDPERPFDFCVVPQRFAAYLAVRRNGDGSFGPQDALEGDRSLPFWVPVHKLFNGSECIAGLDLALELHRQVQNDELASFHKYLDLNGYQNNWRGEHLENFPFTIRNERIASMSARPDFGPGFLEPRPAPLAESAEYQGEPLTFPVDPAITGDPGNWAFSSMQIIPGPPSESPTYMFDASQDTQRPAPEYLNVRHRVLGRGRVENLNLRPDMVQVIDAGGYQAQHYIDYTGDGWIEARCDALAPHVSASQPAYSVVAPPDFYPSVSQRDLMNWWKRDVPQPVREALWAIPPLVLSQTRIAANVELPINFSINDTTVTALVTQATNPGGPVQQPNGPVPQQSTGLPDSSPGLFDPGWDTSQGIYWTDNDEPLQKFLTGHALGAPFIEDAKLCAAYGAYWPGVSPDATREFAPDKLLSGISYPWPTIVPMTDEEIGITPTADGRLMPWDGVRGPLLKDVGGRTLVAYRDTMRVDYLDILGTMTAALTARVDLEEYTARTMAMSAVYWALGIHDPEIMRAAKDHDAGIVAILREKSKWAVRSFQAIGHDHAEMAQALRSARQRAGEQAAAFTAPHLYRFEIFRWGPQSPDPGDLATVLVEMEESAVAYVAGPLVLIRRDNGPWVLDTSYPTS